MSRTQIQVNQNFPDYVRGQKSSVSGLPGFWLDESGKVQLWQGKDYSCPMMIIPYLSSNGLIQACQIRFMCRAVAGEGIRYVWLSTPDKNDGLSCGSPLHYTSYNIHTFNKPILITEGALKAQTVKIFKTECDILASAGVTCSHEEITAAARFRPVTIAFDADYYENAHVARAYARLLNSLFSDSAKLNVQPRVEILTWKPELKGIDDALLQRVSIDCKSPFEWFKSLNRVCQGEVAPILQNLNANFQINL